MEPNYAVPTVTSPDVDYGDDSIAVTEAPAYTITDDDVLSSSGRNYENEYGYYEYVDLNYYEGPVYEVAVYIEHQSINSLDYQLVVYCYNWRYAFITVMLVSLLVFAITLVYLCCAAGKRPGCAEIRPAALNRMPLDIYFLVAGSACCCLIAGCVALVNWAFGTDQSWVFVGLAALLAFAAALTAIAFIYALAAQVKMKNGYWWRHAFCGWCLVKIGRGCKWLFRGARALFRLLPVMWKWLATAAAMVLCVGISFILGQASWGFGEFFWTLVCIAAVFGSIFIVLYGGYCFATLMKGARQMAEGGLYHQIPTERLRGDFREFAEQLNSLAGAARIAAEQQLKSERMKTELITNVSHDIKTPLTSIINYVDLLKKPHSNADGELYLEVLDRQSQRLKKLIDDLMEMSKASTGNMTVEIGQVDAVEAINQALGEFADKLEHIELTPIFRHPGTPVTMMADGRLVWRVLSNLLGNAVKYAMPGTRLYIDLMVLQGNAVIALKNISRDQLNVNADELMERFVRGDTSRNTEGSGLGLNIAKSLVELQHGQMHLMVDGDLFKVTIILPLA